MINEHLLDSENATSINNRDGKIIVYTYPDKCIVVKRVTDEGLVSGMKVLPDPSKTEMIKEKYSGSDNGTVYAGQIKKFELGEHAKDYDYAETKKVMILLGLIVMGAYCTILTINMAIQKDGYG